MKNKGITLIALVITIIILIILAGVGLSVLLGQDGLINKTRMGAFNYKLAAIEEQVLTRQDFDTNANLTLDYSKVFDGVFDPTGISASLKRDIVKEREGIQQDSDLTTEQINTKFNSYLNGDGKIPEIYYVKTDIAGDATPHKFIYDTKTGIALQVPAETIAGYEYHIKTVGNTTTGGVNPGGNTPGGNVPTPPSPISPENLPTSTEIGRDVTQDINNNPDKNYYNTNNPSNKAKLDLGEAINVRLKKIAALAIDPTADVSNYTVATTDNYIKAIKFSTTEPTAAQKVNYGNLAMTMASVLGDNQSAYSSRRILSDIPIYAWYNVSDESIYIWSNSDNHELQLHPHSERMFEGMTELTTIAGFADHWKISDTSNETLRTVRYMFKDTKVTNYNSIGWNVSEWTKTVAYLEAPGNNVFYRMCYNTPNGTPDANKPSHPIFGIYQSGELVTPNAGYWDNEGTFHYGENEPVSQNTLVSKLVAMGDAMPSTYGYTVDYSVSINNTVDNWAWNGSARKYQANGTKNVSETLNDWKLFYCDGTYAYLISTQTVPNTTIAGSEMRRIFNADQCCETDWNPYENYSVLNKVLVSGSKLTSSEKFGTTWSDALSTASNWTQFVDSNYATEAYGGPSLNMWINSWNEKYPSKSITSSQFNNNSITDSSIINEKLYFPDPTYDPDPDSFSGNVSAYYLLSNKYDNDNIYRVALKYSAFISNNIVDAVNEGYSDTTAFGLAIRPVIKLKADVLGSIDTTNGTITLGE